MFLSVFQKKKKKEFQERKLKKKKSKTKMVHDVKSQDFETQTCYSKCDIIEETKMMMR